MNLDSLCYELESTVRKKERKKKHLNKEKNKSPSTGSEQNKDRGGKTINKMVGGIIEITHCEQQGGNRLKNKMKEHG